MRKQKGQVVLILVLVMTVALAIGISVIQRSLSDVSTATRVEQSSRAYSAAEAAIEKAIRLKSNTTVDFSTDNNSSAAVTGADPSEWIPKIAASGTRQDPLEYPPLAKEEVAHVWLADLNDTGNPPADFYKQNTLDVYWGDPAAVSDKAAIELTLVYYNGSQYASQKYFYDQDAARVSKNNFTQVNCAAGTTYQCMQSITFPSSSGLMLLRARLLYNSTSQPFAVRAVGTCGHDCSLPPQATVLISHGISGQTQRTIKLFQLVKVVPPFFDFAVFSNSNINK